MHISAAAYVYRYGWDEKSGCVSAWLFVCIRMLQRSSESENSGCVSAWLFVCIRMLQRSSESGMGLWFLLIRLLGLCMYKYFVNGGHFECTCTYRSKYCSIKNFVSGG